MPVCEECGLEVQDDSITDGLCKYCIEDLHETVSWMRGVMSEAQERYVRAHPEEFFNF